MSRKAVVLDPTLGPLTCDRLTRDISLFQRAKGHRFSSDDVATAYVAYHAAPDAERILDLGCGIGSVLLHLAWTMPRASLVGIEAQEISYALLERNVERAGYGARVRVQRGDVRDAAEVLRAGPPFDLVTGTPPYFPPGTALEAQDTQRAWARMEHRGGMEAYVAAGARALAEGGKLVLCGDARAHSRVEQSSGAHELFIVRRHDFTTWRGRPPLFSSWTLTRRPAPMQSTEFVFRDEAGAPTAQAAELRAFSGFAPREA
jgi:tRNA1Val (adenine37-N6)-methyltransferase